MKWYIGGWFSTVGDAERNNLAYIRANGTLDPAWDPSANAAVHALAVSGNVVYAGGEFTIIGGQGAQLYRRAERRQRG